MEATRKEGNEGEGKNWYLSDYPQKKEWKPLIRREKKKNQSK